MLTRTILRRKFATTISVNASPLNWSLAGSLVTPRVTPAVNTITGSGDQNSNLATIIAEDQSQFPRALHIQAAKSISRGPEIFVEEGEIKGISARIVTNDRQLAQSARGALEGQLELADNGITVLLASDVDFDGQVYYCPERKLAVGNAFGLDNVVQLLNDGAL